MKRDDIEVGETYLFMGSDSPKRKHLAGQPFTVTSKDQVYRKVSYRHKKRSMKVTRFFNDDGVGARAEELGALPGDFTRCRNCGSWSNITLIAPEVEKGPINCPECGEGIALRLTYTKPDQREFPCDQCETGEMKIEGYTSPSGTETFKCAECGHTATFP
jgi:predicted RNA-binding Zn-ribbon protein involved in translation (DUF1610 family)